MVWKALDPCGSGRRPCFPASLSVFLRSVAVSNHSSEAWDGADDPLIRSPRPCNFFLNVNIDRALHCPLTIESKSKYRRLRRKGSIKGWDLNASEAAEKDLART